MKAPNGYGTITKLPGKRRKPYGARVTISIGLDENGKFQQKRKYIGYYATQKEALHALDQYHQAAGQVNSRITFGELYEQWAEQRQGEISISTFNSYRTAFRSVPGLHKEIFADLQPAMLQKAIDESGRGYSSKRSIINLISQLYQYASFNRIILSDINPSHLLKAGKQPKSNIHHRFNEKELQELWRHKNNEDVQIILMTIYSGVRPGEMFDLRNDDVHIQEKYFYIRQGKNKNAVRAVPIADKVLPFFQNWKQKNSDFLITENGKKFDFSNYREYYAKKHWRPALESLGIYFTSDPVTGESYHHLPHDCRHTFASMWADKQLNEQMRRKIQGHTGKGVGEQVYTHIDIQRMIEEVNKL